MHQNIIEGRNLPKKFNINPANFTLASQYQAF